MDFVFKDGHGDRDVDLDGDRAEGHGLDRAEGHGLDRDEGQDVDLHDHGAVHGGDRGDDDDDVVL